MRYIFFLLLQLYIPCRASIPTQVASKPSRYRRRRSHGGVRGRTVRRLSSANIFNHNRNVNIDPLGGVMKHAALAFEARTMFKPNQLNTGGSSGTNLGILDLPRKTMMIMRMGMGMGQSTKGNIQSSSVDETMLVLDLTGPEHSKSQHVGGLSLPLEGVSSPDDPLQLPPKSKVMGGTSAKVSQKSKGSRKSKRSKASMKSMKMDVVKPTIPPTKVPTIASTPMPTTPAPTISPTTTPVIQTSPPTFPPTPMACMVDGDGNVGSMNGKTTLYDFFYQLEVVAGMTAEEVDDSLLKDVEIAMANALIPTLFPEQCGDGRKLQANNIPATEGRYIGLSTRPPDFVLSGFTCSGNYLEPCYIISGATTVYTVGLSNEQIQDELQMEIEAIIQSGRLADQFDEIKDMTLLDDNLNPVTPSPSTPEPTVDTTPHLTTEPTTPTEAPAKVVTSPPTPAPDVTPIPTTIMTQPPDSTSIPTITLAPFSTSGSPTNSSTPPPTVATRAPSSDQPESGGPPLFPLWAWTVLGVGLGVLCIICIYLNRGEGHVNLEGEDSDDQLTGKFSTGEADDYVPPGPSAGYLPPPSQNMVAQTPASSQVAEPNRYLQSAEHVALNKVEPYSDSEAGDEPVADSNIPTNIALDPDAEEMESEGDEEEEEEEEEEEDEFETDDGDEEYEDEEESAEEESESEESEPQQSVLGEFQVVQVEPNVSFQQEEESESESESSGEGGGEEDGEEEDDDEEDEEEEYEEEYEEEEGEEDEYDEEDGEEDSEDSEGGEEEEVVDMDEEAEGKEGEESESSYDEETYAEQESYMEESLEEQSHGEESYEEEVIEESGDELEGEQSWLAELQQAQAGHYPSYGKSPSF